ncbi:MAG: ArsR family transcriptional regulator [Chloroflexi bacterium]|nr:ArsR family transcriptional regulator [Chloroflexota bacterium]
MGEAKSAETARRRLIRRAHKQPEAGQTGTQTLPEIDRLVHEPARLVILTLLNAVDSADFLFLLGQTGLTRGNLSSHLSKLEEVGYIQVQKEFVNKVPRTRLHIRPRGRQALQDYREGMARLLESLPR